MASTLAAKGGRTVERCIESVPNRKLAHRIEEDSFGFSRMFSDFWFAFSLEREGLQATLVRIETHYDPRGIGGRLMSALIAKRQFRRVRKTALSNLKRLAESTSARNPAALPAVGSLSEAG